MRIQLWGVTERSVRLQLCTGLSEVNLRRGSFEDACARRALNRVHLGGFATCTYFQNIPSHVGIGLNVVPRACDHYCILLVNLTTLTNGGFSSAITRVIFKELGMSPYQNTETVSFLPVSWTQLRTWPTDSRRGRRLITLILISSVPGYSVCVNVHSLEVWTWGFSFPPLLREKPKRFIPRAGHSMTWDAEICCSLGKLRVSVKSRGRWD